jgi:hypothetical protein
MHIKLTNGVPAKYTLGQLRRDNPNISFPKRITNEMLASYDVYPYTVQGVNHDPITQTKSEGELSQLNGQWVLSMVAENLPIEQAERQIRLKRDEDLQQTDWLVVKSYERSENIPSEWEIYRQELRDVTDQSGFPYDVAWPAKP